MNKYKFQKNMNVGAGFHPCPEKGITLVALIITIILMLILATVTINVVFDGGLFEHAGNVKESVEVVNEKDNGKYFQKVLETTDFGIKLEKPDKNCDE